MSSTETWRIPERPNLAQERKRAKDLFKALRNDDSDAIARLRSHHPRFSDLTPGAKRAADLKLSDAQWIIAREYGFPSWSSLKSHIEYICGRAADRMCDVLMFNDNETPIEFVAFLLQKVFQKDADEAQRIALDTHHHGISICAGYDRREDAMAKIGEARNLARHHGHPLQFWYAYGPARAKIKSATDRSP